MNTLPHLVHDVGISLLVHMVALVALMSGVNRNLSEILSIYRSKKKKKRIKIQIPQGQTIRPFSYNAILFLNELNSLSVSKLTSLLFPLPIEHILLSSTFPLIPLTLSSGICLLQAQKIYTLQRWSCRIISYSTLVKPQALPLLTALLILLGYSCEYEDHKVQYKL